MATQASSIKKIENVRAQVLNTAKTAHNTIFNTANDLLDGTISNAEKMQKLAAKTIKNTEPLLEKQVDIMFDTVEEVYTQIDKSSVRFQKLLGITDQVSNLKKYIGKSVKMTASTLEENYEIVAKNAKSVVAKVENKLDDISATVKKSSEKADKKVTSATKDIKASATKTVKTATTRAATIKRSATKTVKATVPTAKKVLTSSTATAKKLASKAVANVETEVKEVLDPK